VLSREENITLLRFPSTGGDRRRSGRLTCRFVLRLARPVVPPIGRLLTSLDILTAMKREEKLREQKEHFSLRDPRRNIIIELITPLTVASTREKGTCLVSRVCVYNKIQFIEQHLEVAAAPSVARRDSVVECTGGSFPDH